MMKFATRAIRAGQEPDPATGSINVPIYQTANFMFQGVGKPGPYEYSRTSNPTRRAFEECLASLEEGNHGLAFASGMAAIDAALSVLRYGDHVIVSENLYGGTYGLIEKVWKERGVEFSYVDGTRPSAFAEAIRPATRMVWIETPANPLLQLVDVRAVAAITHKQGAVLVADNTFASPYFQRPLNQGVDIVVHSATKYISGHSDVIAGAIVVNDAQLFEQLSSYQKIVGAVAGPFDSWLGLRGLKTLEVRMKQHESNARRVAEWLAADKRVESVLYPGLASHPQHELARAQMDGFGAIVTLRLRGGLEAVRRFLDGLKVFTFAGSLGGVESLVSHPWTMSHQSLSPEDKNRIGITEGTLRLSIGIEDADDMIVDLDKALGRI
jgi:cystathionine gamma-lyase